MKSLARTAALAALVPLAANTAAATVSLEIASQRGLQSTAPQQWLQLLTKAGVSNVRIRGAQTGDAPAVETLATRRGDVHHVTGVLTARDQLLLPGGRFTRRDSAKLRDYFDRLKADGAEAVTEPTGNFGLTREQFEAVFDELQRPLAITTKGLSPQELVDRVGRRLRSRIAIDGAIKNALRAAEPLEEELGSFSMGTGLAIALRGAGLALVPTKPRGGEVEFRIKPIGEGSDAWPIGYPVEGPPRNAAPDVMQAINVEIDGFTLAEAVDAITPRLKTPVLWNRRALAERRVDPSAIEVKLARAKLSYKRILEKLAFQARLRAELRVDEAGTPFFWVTK